MVDRIAVPWLPRIGGFKTNLVQLVVAPDHISPLCALWLVATGDERGELDLQHMCARDLKETVSYRFEQDQWRWVGEEDPDGQPLTSAPAPDQLFTTLGVAEAWLFGVHKDAALFGEAATSIYEALIVRRQHS